MIQRFICPKCNLRFQEPTSLVSLKQFHSEPMCPRCGSARIMDHWEWERARQENRKREELRDSLIAFLKSNTDLGRSLEYAAERIALAIENTGGSFSAALDQVGAIMRELESGVSQSELPQLISEMRDAVGSINARRRLLR